MNCRTLALNEELKQRISPTVLLHDAQEFDNDLGAGSDENLTLASLLGVVDGIKRIVENTGLDHFDGDVRFSLCDWDNEVSV